VPVKVTVNLPEDAVAFLKGYAESRGITMTEALRRLISNENYLVQEVEEGGKVLIEKKDKTVRELVLA
jgi:hypothetical protein